VSAHRRRHRAGRAAGGDGGVLPRARRGRCGNFVDSEPTRHAEVVFGVAACLYLDGLAAEDVLDSWARAGELAS
jgi:hypothetical protein